MQRVLWSIVAAGSIMCSSVNAQRFDAYPTTVHQFRHHSINGMAFQGYGYQSYGNGSRGYPIYGYSTIGSVAPYGMGYVNDPYQSGSFKIPDLLDDPLFIQQHRYESRFPGRRRR
ncbi:hypothetical protein Q31b_45240 [Novipirellula aureliae]|uniref:Glycosyl hydrolase family 92 N-terminal domain-containing protein n=1 Tax=Novipirellula aureliae TaxID=2527966 RepID=A0A5C6DNH1_9BACT|nr:hypothetical protein [Novipirellula aureliae]TWU37735.1 hypothetical protein Q31b_45240 [Novipirellula aureliae]